jgi:hypothetical protein
MKIVPLVEGHGDVEAVPVLLRRVAQERGIFDLEVATPIRVPRSRLIKPGELEKGVELASRKGGPDGAILVVLDADDDCPAALGPSLLQRAQAARPDRTVSVVLAKREFESWFLAGAESLRGQRGLASDLATPPEPESIRGAKEWLRQRMPGTHGYRETVDQAPLAQALDLQSARRKSDSLDKFMREAALLLQSP